MSSPAESTPSTAQGAVKALGKIAVAGAVMLGIYFGYSKYVENSKRMKDLSKKAFEMVQRDNRREYEEAKKLLDEALSIRDKDAFAVSARAEIAALLWVEHGLLDNAGAARRFLEIARDQKYNLAERFSAEGLVLIGDGKAQEAETEIAGIAANAANAKIIAALGMAHARLGRADTARNDFKSAADRDWRSPRFTTLYAEAFYAHGDFLSAQGTFQKALELNPAHLRAMVGKARADIARSERTDEAKAAIAEVLAKPESEMSPVIKAHALMGNAELALATGDFAAAEQAAREALAVDARIDPGFAFASYDLGLALARAKKDGALEAFKAAIAQDAQVQRFYYRGALALAEAGRVADGEVLFAEAEKTLKKNDVFHVAKADFLVITGGFEPAHAEYDLAAKENEVNPEIYFKKGLLYQKQAMLPKADKRKLFDNARQQYEKAVGIREKYPEVYRQMGLIYLDVKPTAQEAGSNFLKTLTYYKEQKAPKIVVEGFIAEVEAKYLAAKLKSNATSWRKEATDFMR